MKGVVLSGLPGDRIFLAKAANTNEIPKGTLGEPHAYTDARPGVNLLQPMPPGVRSGMAGLA